MNISKNKTKYAAGFSLTEMLIATGIMAIGLMMVATVFPVGIKLTSLSTERSVGSIVADEAFAKVRLYGLRDFDQWPEALIETNINGNANYANSAEATYYAHSDFLYTLKGVVDPVDGNYGTDDDDFFWFGDPVSDAMFLEEFRYPSADISTGEKYRYHWSAMCRRVGLKDVQVTVFVTRKALGGVTYYNYPFDYSGTGNYLTQNKAIWPSPVKANVQFTYSNGLRELVLNASDPINAIWGNNVYSFIEEGYTIVDDRSGTIYRVLETEDIDGDGFRETITLWEDWQWIGFPNNPPAVTVVETVWVVPPGVGSSRYPCVGVYQKIIRFDDIN